MSIIKLIFTSFKGLLNYPIIRYILAGASIVALVYFLTILPLKKENSLLRGDYKDLVDKQGEIVKKLSERPTYSIENKVDVKKSKDGSNINLVPENTMNTVNVTNKSDSIQDPKGERVGLRFWKKEFWKKGKNGK